MSMWRTLSANQTIILNVARPAANDLAIDWGDGPTESYSPFNPPSHVYQTAGLWTIRMYGSEIRFKLSSIQNQKLEYISSWGAFIIDVNSANTFANASNLRSITASDSPKFLANANMDFFFAGCSSLDSALSWNTTTVTSMRGTFQNATSLNSPIVFNTRAVVDFSYMFNFATSFNQSASFDLTSAKNLTSMFESAWALNRQLTFKNTGGVQDLTNLFADTRSFNQSFVFDSASVTSFEGTFKNSVFNRRLNLNTQNAISLKNMFWSNEKFNSYINFTSTSKVTNMEGMFGGAISYNLPFIIPLNTSNVVSLRAFAQGAVAFNQRLDWNTSNVQDFSYMFAYARAFNSQTPFSTSKAQSVQYMFAYASAYNVPISFDFSRATSLEGFLVGASSFNQAVILLNTSRVTSTKAMFQGCSNFNQDITFDLSNNMDTSDMFWNARNYNVSLASTMNTKKVRSMFRMFDGSATTASYSQLNTTAVTNCSRFCLTCGLPLFPNCNPCTPRLRSADNRSVCGCARYEIANPKDQCVPTDAPTQFPTSPTNLFTARPTPECSPVGSAPPSPDGGSVLPPTISGTGIYYIPRNARFLSIGGGMTVYLLPSALSALENSTDNSTRHAILISPLDPELMRPGEIGHLIQADISIEFQAAVDQCSPSCMVYEADNQTLGRSCLMVQNAAQGIRCGCNSTYMAYIYQGTVCEPPASYGFIFAIVLFGLFMCYASMYVVLQRFKGGWMRVLRVFLVAAICGIKMTHNQTRIPGQSMSDTGRAFLIVVPPLLQYVLVRCMVTPRRKKDVYCTNGLTYLMLGLGMVLFSMPSVGSGAVLILVMDGVVCAVEVAVLSLLLYLIYTHYFASFGETFSERCVTLDFRLLACCLILLALQSATECFGFAQSKFLLHTTTVSLICDYLFLSVILLHDRREMQKFVNLSGRPLPWDSADPEKAWFDSYVQDNEMRDSLFSSSQVKFSSEETVNSLRPLITLEAEYFARRAEGEANDSLFRALNDEIRFSNPYQNLPSFLTNSHTWPHAHPFVENIALETPRPVHHFTPQITLLNVANTECTVENGHTCSGSPCIAIKRGEIRPDLTCFAIQRFLTCLWAIKGGEEMSGVYCFIPKYLVVDADFLCIHYFTDAFFFREVSQVSDKCMRQLVLSSVGLFLAAYVLGIQSDNFMITPEGHAFSFDFNRFLHLVENPSFPISREFFLKVKEQAGLWVRFVEYMVSGYMVIRAHYTKLLRLALLSGFDQLQVSSFLSSRLQLNVSESEARANIRYKLENNEWEAKRADTSTSSPRADLVLISLDSIEVTRQLGQGAFGRVDQCIWTGADCAIKRPLNTVAHHDFKREMEIYRYLAPYKHQHVVSFLGITNPPGILMELHPFKSVEEFVLRNGNLQSESDFMHILTILISGSAGLMHLHKYGVIHRDIAARNFLLKHDLSTAICDFGLALILPSDKEFGQRTHAERKTDLLPINSSAPETALMGQFSAKSDVFMFGNFIWELLARQQPHAGDKDLSSEGTQNFPSFVHRVGRGLRPSIPEQWPEELKSLIQSCWELIPANRPTMTDVNRTLRNFRTFVEQERLPLPVYIPQAQRAVLCENNYYEALASLTLTPPSPSSAERNQSNSLDVDGSAHAIELTSLNSQGSSAYSSCSSYSTGSRSVASTDKSGYHSL